MNRIHTACLSIYCSLMLSSLVFSRHNVKLAAVGGGIEARVQNGALEALQAASKQGFSVGNVSGSAPGVVVPVAVVSKNVDPMQKFAETIRTKGHDDTMSAKSLALFGLGGPTVNEKEVDMSVGSEARGAELFAVNGHEYIALGRRTSQDAWEFLFDDSGKVVSGFHGAIGSGTGMHPLAQDQTQTLASAEKGFWLQWVADGAKVGSKS